MTQRMPWSDNVYSYQHRRLGVLTVLVTPGCGNGGDIVWLYGAMENARIRLGEIEPARPLTAAEMERQRTVKQGKPKPR